MHRYRVEALESGKAYPIYEPLSDAQMYGDEWNKELGSTESFSFTIPRGSELLLVLNPLSTKVRIYDGDKIKFEGRVISDKRDMLNTGMIQVAGPESYLSDSQQPPFQYSGTIEGFMQMLFEFHNSQNDVKFTVGTVTVTDPNNNIVRTLNQYADTLTVLREKTEGMLGGWLKFRRQSETQYAVDYQWDYGQNNQIIRFSENLLDIQSTKAPENFFTRIIPLGSELNANDTTDLPQYVTIKAVNGGMDYLENADLRERYGIITKVEQWKDVTEPANLLRKAQQYMKEHTDFPKTFEISAVDLSYIEDMDELEIGKMTHISSPPNNLEADYLLAKKTIHITQPANDTITLGEVQQTLTQETVKNESQTSQTIEDVKTDANNTIVQTGMTISGAKGGYVVLDSYDDHGNATAPWQILIMDSQDKKTARNVIRMNQNGIGFSTDGYDGTYRNAWTIDGTLNADFVRTGDLVLGGTIYNKDGSIVIKNSSDEIIGRWNKDGLMVKKGAIEGTSINIGAFAADADTLSFGLFSISDEGKVFQAPGFKITVGPDGQADSALIVYQGNFNIVNIEDDIYFDDPWTEGMSLLDMLKDLYNRTAQM